MKELTWKQQALYERMSDISEECYAAGWMSGNEYTLWNMVANPQASRFYGMCDVAESEIAQLLEIAQEIGGWIRWVDDDESPNISPAEWGPAFTPMEQWLPMFERRMAEWDAMRDRYTQAGGVK